ncbi:hypothetical protein QRX60_36735 [Amycolatopsis mongoliensis]|uniref:Uncharacterized protein n=1 Tax=Amycolatopsis mongoliensis TaxID=715475 RepID=A0A9Y2NFA9_9PSEU|nr:hypothetical protein [Amycolatopsis sp. 4-36]WIX99563.1 hypothetical protein QRX60_36735 [Amycolatopsis sp. 4-36]
MTDRLGHHQTAAMLTLMALGRQVLNPELKELVGFTLTGKDRTQLQDGGYITSVQVSKPGRPYAHELTEDGWAWCLEELAVGSPPETRAQSHLCSALYVFASRLGEHLGRRNLQWADIIPGPAKSLENRIRTAYLELVSEPRGWVALVDLRPKLGGAPAEEVDVVLKELSRTGKAHLVPEENRKALTTADHQAAIRIGGEDNHLISIEAS